jgi:hypothetical protein
MAVIQISKIQVRRGYQENLPQLGSGEMGWSIDERRLFIGNGTLSEGAPEIGNTEILTIYSPIGAALANIGIIESNITTLQSQVAALQANATTTIYTISLADNTATATNTAVIFGSTSTNFDYTISRANAFRSGTIISTQVNGSTVYQDDYSETADTGVTLSLFAYGNAAVVRYITTSNGFAANLTYYPPRQFA